MRRYLIPLLAGLTFVGLASQPVSAKKKSGTPVPTTPTTVPQSNVFIRAGFDDDPSLYLGRFIQDGVAIPDETSASKTTCSQYITYRKVGGGGVVYDDLMVTQTSAASRLGIPPLAAASGSGNAQTIVRVTYTLTDKMVADITDPAAFDACCEENPDQCSGKYIGEFMGGTGAFWYIHTSATDLEIQAAMNGAAGDVQFSHGTLWRRGIQFPNPVYFAFKTTDVMGDDCQVAPGCGDWTRQAPRCSGGMYFVGQSSPMDDETVAKDIAQEHARKQVLQWASTTASGGSSSSGSYNRSGGSGTSAGAGENFYEERFEGVVKQLKDRNTCVVRTPTPDGPSYQVYVLSFLPKSVVDQLTAN